MIKTVLSAFALCLFTLPTHAQVSLTQTVATTYCDFENFLVVQIDNDPSLPVVTCDDVAPLNDIYTQVAAISSVPLAPSLLNVQNKVIEQFETYELLRSRFGVGASTEDQKLSLDEMFAHEMGHHIFYSYVFENVSAYSGNINEFRKLYINNMVTEHATLRGKDLVTSPSYVEFDRMIDMMANYAPNELAKFDILSEAYQELFGDVVAAVLFDEANVVVRSHEAFGHDSSKFRSFTTNAEITAQSARIHHYYFASIRATLWNEWITPRMGDKKKLLDELFQVFISEIERRSLLEFPETSSMTDEQVIELNKVHIAALLEKLNLNK